MIWRRVVSKKTVDYTSRNFKKAVLDGQDFSMSLLIAANLEGCSLRGANFLGADLRDSNLKNADLSERVFQLRLRLTAQKKMSILSCLNL